MNASLRAREQALKAVVAAQLTGASVSCAPACPIYRFAQSLRLHSSPSELSTNPIEAAAFTVISVTN